jgi:hypothetical protein
LFNSLKNIVKGNLLKYVKQLKHQMVDTSEIITKDVLKIILTNLETPMLVEMRIVNSLFKNVSDIIIEERAFHINDDLKLEQLFRFAYLCTQMDSIDVNINETITDSQPSYLSDKDTIDYAGSDDEITPYSLHKNIKYNVSITETLWDLDPLDCDQDGFEKFPCEGECGEDCIKGECPCITVIPDFEMESILHFDYPIKVENRHGPNSDLRGVQKPEIEFADFHNVWTWRKGLITVRKFVEDCYRLKSHKFENWYEWIHGITCTDSKAIIPFTHTYERSHIYERSGYQTFRKFDAYLVELDPTNRHSERYKSDKVFFAELSVDHGS